MNEENKLSVENKKEIIDFVQNYKLTGEYEDYSDLIEHVKEKINNDYVKGYFTKHFEEFDDFVYLKEEIEKVINYF